MNKYQKVNTRFKPFLMNDVPSQCFEFVDRDNPTIIQIGANDGIIGEDYGFHEFLSELDSFNLYLIEPISHYFNNLKNIYDRFSGKNKNIIYLNYAITEQDGVYNIIDDAGCSYISDHGIEIIGQSWNTFIKDNNINKIDLLMLDCEGYEYTILNTIDYSKIIPQVIRYEFVHNKNILELDHLLMNNKYYVSLCETDPIYNKVAIQR